MTHVSKPVIKMYFSNTVVLVKKRGVGVGIVSYKLASACMLHGLVPAPTSPSPQHHSGASHATSLTLACLKCCSDNHTGFLLDYRIHHIHHFPLAKMKPVVSAMNAWSW